MQNIIVAEDEPILRNLIAKTLGDAGYTVRVAANGQEAWDLIQEQAPDAVLSDLLMPVMTGYELLSHIHEDNSLKCIPCLVLSNSGQIDDLNRAYDLGAEAVLIKANFNPDQLVTRLKELFSTPQK